MATLKMLSLSFIFMVLTFSGVDKVTSRPEQSFPAVPNFRLPTFPPSFPPLPHFPMPTIPPSFLPVPSFPGSLAPMPFSIPGLPGLNPPTTFPVTPGFFGPPQAPPTQGN